MPHKIQIHFTKKSIKSASTSQNVNRISNLKVKISIKGEKKPKQDTDFSGLPVKLAFSTLTFHNKDIIQKKIAFLFYFFFVVVVHMKYTALKSEILIMQVSK